jgi:hypothetical protein
MRTMAIPLHPPSTGPLRLPPPDKACAVRGCRRPRHRNKCMWWQANVGWVCPDHKKEPTLRQLELELLEKGGRP